MSAARDLYHRLIPGSIRNPIGLARRRFTDRLRRAITSPAVPPPALLANIQLTPYANEYLSIGKRSAATVQRLVDSYLGRGSIRLLDFGCGSARLLRHFRNSGWQLSGCDVDAPAVAWAARNIPFASFRSTSTTPPLPYAPESFDVVVAISLFTHFSPRQQHEWLAEIARILVPGGVALISTMGPSVIENFPALVTAKTVAQLDREGYVFIEHGESFNSNAAFHTMRGLATLAADHFDLRLWSQQGLDGFQDLSVLRRRD